MNNCNTFNHMGLAQRMRMPQKGKSLYQTNTKVYIQTLNHEVNNKTCAAMIGFLPSVIYEGKEINPHTLKLDDNVVMASVVSAILGVVAASSAIAALLL